MARRSYGTGSLFERTDKSGVVHWYGKWRQDGVQVKRRIGPKDRLNRSQANAELRRLMTEIQPAPPVSEVVTIAKLGREYLADIERRGRKKSTVLAVETALHAHLEPFFGDRSITSIRYEDVVDLLAVMRGKKLSPKSMRNYISTLSTLYRFAMHPRRRWASQNPCDGIELDAVPDYQGIRYLDPGEVDLLVLNTHQGPTRPSMLSCSGRPR